MSLLDDLLERGYFPVQLPPGFTTASFASGRQAFEKKWRRGNPPATLPAKYSVARSSYYRRMTSLVNPIGFYFLAKEIDAYWPQIENHYAESQLSKSVPSLGGTLRAIQLRKFSELYEEKITSAAGFQYALVTDLTSFFPTIYTHTVPWALHTKVIAKQMRKEGTPEYFGNSLDVRGSELIRVGSV